MAQAVYLAQLEACKNGCQCKTCQILRKATESLTTEFLAADLSKVDETVVEMVKKANEGV